MIVTVETYNGLLKPMTVGEQNPTVGALRSLQRRREGYLALAEVKNQLLVVGDVIVDGDETTFRVTKGARYDDMFNAVYAYMSWDTDTDSINYEHTTSQWRWYLGRNSMNADVIARIKENDLTDPRFGDFSITLMEYLLTCKRDGNKYYPAADFTA